MNQIGTKFKKARSYLENNQEETEEATEIWPYISSKYYFWKNMVILLSDGSPIVLCRWNREWSQRTVKFHWKEQTSQKKWFIPIIFPSVFEFTAVFSHRERSLFSVIEPTSQTAHCYKGNHSDNLHSEIMWDWKHEDTASGWHTRYVTYAWYDLPSPFPVLLPFFTLTALLYHTL